MLNLIIIMYFLGHYLQKMFATAKKIMVKLYSTFFNFFESVKVSCWTGIALQNAAFILPPKQSFPKQQVKINNFAQWKKIPPFKEVSKTLSHQKTSICMWQPDSSVCPSERRRRRRRHLLVSNYGRHQKSKRWTAAVPLLISIKIDCLIWHWPRKLQGFLVFRSGKNQQKNNVLCLCSSFMSSP